jgi:hypothetical protein
MTGRTERSPRPEPDADALVGPSGNGHPLPAPAFSPDAGGVMQPGPSGPIEGRAGLRRWLTAAALALVATLAAVLAGPTMLSWFRPQAPSGLLFASGRIEGRITTLTPKASARVVALHVDEGQPVTSGQLLATLDDQAQRARVRSAEEQLNALTEPAPTAGRPSGMPSGRPCWWPGSLPPRRPSTRA